MVCVVDVRPSCITSASRERTIMPVNLPFITSFSPASHQRPPQLYKYTQRKLISTNDCEEKWYGWLKPLRARTLP